MSVIKNLYGNLAESLMASTLGRCSRWAEKVRVMSEGPWSFDKHPWLRQMHDDSSNQIVIKKGAQMGVTEYALNRTLFTLDQLKKHTLYALPNERPSAMAFSKGRINTASDLSPYISGLFAISRGEGHKITRDAVNLYIRGANSRTGFKEIPVSMVVLDEMDEMEEEAIRLAEYRVDGQDDYQIIKLSTPSIDGKGIDKHYQDTTQCLFNFKCPRCSKYIHLSLDNLVVTAEHLNDPNIANSHLICTECRGVLPHEEKQYFLKDGIWVPTYPNNLKTGYHINQLYSCAKAIHPSRLATRFLEGQYDIVAKTEFYNSSLGQCFTDDGAQITEDTINKLQRDYFNADMRQRNRYKFVTIGIDIGQFHHHYAVVGWNFDATKGRDILAASMGRLLHYGTVDSFDQLDELINTYRPHKVVVDAQPDTNSSISLARRFKGLAYACYYSTAKQTKQITIREDECTISVNRSFWLGTTFTKLTSQSMDLPKDISLELRQHLTSTAKTYSKDDNGNVQSEFVKRDHVPDHFLHAINYSIIALGLMTNK